MFITDMGMSKQVAKTQFRATAVIRNLRHWSRPCDTIEETARLGGMLWKDTPYIIIAQDLNGKGRVLNQYPAFIRAVPKAPEEGGAAGVEPAVAAKVPPPQADTDQASDAVQETS
jgi:hypothetical protein